MKKIRIYLSGTQHDYQDGLVPLLIRELGYEIDWVQSTNCDLLIYGAFYQEVKKSSWIPKLLRPLMRSKKSGSRSQYRPLTLFHTCESLRHNHVAADFSISFDLGVRQENHLRLPYWYELVDWSHEGICGNHNPRYGELLSLKRLCEPLGSNFLARPQKAVLISSHLMEPRKMIFDAVGEVIPVTGMGPFFDPTIRNHHQSSFCKKEILSQFAFNLCPENNLYPGYYTEKIPEAFLSGCLALGWVDSNVSADFNPKAFINLQPMVKDHFRELNELLHSREHLLSYTNEPLVLQPPSLEPAKQFLSEIIRQALS
jgi:hypothetical protein